MRKSAHAFALLLLSVAGTTAQELDVRALEDVARAELAETKTPGAAIAVVSGDRVVLAQGVGVANVETGVPVTPDMLFRLGSTTKMFTAAALVTLSLAGKIPLHEPIGTRVSGILPKLAAITPHQLLTHTAGIRDEAPMFGRHDDAALGDGIRTWTEDYFFTEPGRLFSYSNPGYWAAGFLVETVGGKPYADMMEELLFEPLGMSRTTLRPTMAMTHPLAQGHETSADGQPSVIRPAANNASGWPAGSMFSSALDLSRFTIAFLNVGRIDGRVALSPEVVYELSTPYVSVPGSRDAPRDYGYGLNVGLHRGVRVWEHAGSRAGYGSIIRMAPDQRFAVIVLGNRTGVSLRKTADKAMEMLLPLAPTVTERPPHGLSLGESDRRRYVGAYSQGSSDVVRIDEKDGRLFFHDGSREAPLIKVADYRLATHDGTTELSLIPGSDGRAQFLYRGTRAHVRVADEDPFTEIDGLARAELAKDNLGSVTVGVVSGGKLAWTKSYGFADMEKKEPATPDHVYRIGSITKQFTGLMLLQLVERGKARLSDPVEKYLPEIHQVKGIPGSAPPITLIQMATMTAGLDREPKDLPTYLKGPVAEWEKVAFRAARETSFAFEPGTRYHYSNIGYALLGAALSRAAGVPYVDYVREQILRPLGMSQTDFEPTPSLRPHVARGYSVENGNVDPETPAREHEGRGYKVPNGALYTTVGDLARFVVFQLGSGPEEVLGKGVREENLARLSTATGDLASGCGIGFQSLRRGELVARGHGGSVAGYQAAAYFDLKSRTGVIVLRNVGGGAFNVTGLALSALEIMANRGPKAGSTPPSALAKENTGEALREKNTARPSRAVEDENGVSHDARTILLRTSERGVVKPELREDFARREPEIANQEVAFDWGRRGLK